MQYTQTQGKTQQIPGYTGHKPGKDEEDVAAMMAAQTRMDDGTGTRIPGYKGYVPGIRSENVFGQTYGSTTRGQAAGLYPKGFDFNDKERYNTVSKGTYTDQMVTKVYGRQSQMQGSPAKGAMDLSYQEASQQASWKRKLDPNPQQKVPMLTD